MRIELENLWNILRGEGFPKTKKFKEMHEVELEFQRVGRSYKKSLLWGRYGYFIELQIFQENKVFLSLILISLAFMYFTFSTRKWGKGQQHPPPPNLWPWNCQWISLIDIVCLIDRLHHWLMPKKLRLLALGLYQFWYKVSEGPQTDFSRVAKEVKNHRRWMAQARALYYVCKLLAHVRYS